ncbi:MAG: dihydrofolate reductase family protein [Thermoleophilia bacterium]|nr:dihydrofolate reductase family protein [Thermoleophilia bacterium]
MRKVLLNLTTSLDGFIADRNGGIDWLLPMPEEVPSDYHELMATVDTLVMGRVTYETSISLEGGVDIFEGKKVFVFTQRKDLKPLAGVAFIHESAEKTVTGLKEEDGGTIWLFGGGQLATALSDAGLIDEYLIAVQPILLGDGIPLWRTPHASTRLESTMARIWTDGLVEMRYRQSRMED